MKAAEIIKQIQSGEIELDEVLLPGRPLYRMPPEKLIVETLSTGFPTLDHYSILKKGAGELIVVGGRPSVGKSAFMFQMAYNVAHHSPVHVFSLEMSHEAVLSRTLSMLLDCSVKDLQQGLLTAEALKDAYSALMQLKYTIDDRSGLNVSDISELVRKRHKQDGTSLVVIDYLTFIQMEKTATRDVEVGIVTKALKNLAKELKIPIVIGSQLSRQSEQRGASSGNYKPKLADLRESGNIEQDADVVLFVHREQDQNGIKSDFADIIVAKNRNGSCGTVEMRFEGRQTRFIDEG